MDGQKLRVGPRDFAITPNGTWHEHGNESDDAPVIWQDGLDIPLVNALDAGFYEVHPELRQIPGQVVNSSVLSHGTNLLPYGMEKWTRPYSPVFGFPWEPTYRALLNLAKATEGSPFDGVIMEYTNPRTGGSVMPTMGAHIQLLRPNRSYCHLLTTQREFPTTDYLSRRHESSHRWRLPAQLAVHLARE